MLARIFCKKQKRLNGDLALRFHGFSWNIWHIHGFDMNKWRIYHLRSWSQKLQKHGDDQDAKIISIGDIYYIYGYGSIPINTIFSGMNIHLPAILMFTKGTRFWHTAIYIYMVIDLKVLVRSFAKVTFLFAKNGRSRIKEFWSTTIYIYIIMYVDSIISWYCPLNLPFFDRES